MRHWRQPAVSCAECHTHPQTVSEQSVNTHYLLFFSFLFLFRGEVEMREIERLAVQDRKVGKQFTVKSERPRHGGLTSREKKKMQKTNGKTPNEGMPEVNE